MSKTSFTGVVGVGHIKTLLNEVKDQAKLGLWTLKTHCLHSTTRATNAGPTQHTFGVWDTKKLCLLRM